MAKHKFEGEVGKIREVLDQLESGDLGLEESLEAFEKGVKSLRTCETILSKVEDRIRVLVDDEEKAFDIEGKEEED